MFDHYRPSPLDKGQYSTQTSPAGFHSLVTNWHSWGRGRGGSEQTWALPAHCPTLPMHKPFSWFASMNTPESPRCFARGASSTARTCASSLQSVTSTNRVQQVPKGWVKGYVCALPAGWQEQRKAQLGGGKGLACLQTHIPRQPSLQVADQRSQLLWCKLDLFSPSHTQIQATDERSHAGSCYLWGAV